VFGRGGAPFFALGSVRLVKHWSNTGQTLVKRWSNAPSSTTVFGRGGAPSFAVGFFCDTRLTSGFDPYLTAAPPLFARV
jgi:hypothetical protein